MTLVLAMVDDKGNIHAGADSAIGGENEIYEFHEPKVFIKGPYLLGYCQSARLGQVLRYHFDAPEPLPDAEDLSGFMVATFVPALRRVLETHGAMTPGLAEMPKGSVVMVGYRSQLWCIATNLTVTRMTPRAAIGSGRGHAYGALHALMASGSEAPGRIIELAMEAAATHAPRVRPPFRFLDMSAASSKSSNLDDASR